MIAAWMLYCVAIAILFAVVGEALERALHLAGRPTRWAWVVALAGSYLVPAAAWLRPSAFGALPVPLAHPAVAGLQPTAGPSDPQPEGAALPAPTRSFSLGDLDAPLTWAWGLSSAALLLSLGVAALRLAARRRVWRRATVDGRAVLVSDDVGPAVAGLWRPRIVLPEWALRLTDAERRLMLAHEDEHVRARDPWLLAAAAALVLLAPWNLMLWWQLGRLRLAVEMDCDARVLAHDGDAPAYGELLLRVVQRRARLPLGAPALGEPVSFLGRRIRRMATALPRWRWPAAIAATSVAVAAVIAACEAPRPMASEAPDPQYARAGRAEHEAAEVDSARAIAIALRNLCGVPAVDTTCLVRSYEYTSGHHVVVLDRRPPAGNDRVAVQVSGVVGNVYLKANELPFAQRAPQSVSVTGGLERPVVVSGPRLQYPNLLRQAGIEGRVIVRAVIDTTGRAEPASVQVVESTHPGFNQAARDFVLHARFSHGRLHGRAVRVLITFPVNFRMGK